VQIDNIVKAIKPGYEISSNGPKIEAIPSKSNKDTAKDDMVVISSTIGKRLLPIKLNEHKYLA
jgi:hypothetical protein